MDNVRDLFANTGNAHLGYSLRNAASEYFVIDGEARTITPPANFKHFGVESDEKTARVWFECPQIVGDNIDLATLNLRVNFKNANGDKDIYIVDDVEADGLNIRFSWLLSRKVTFYKGNVSFIVCAVKTGSDGKIKNEWNTTLCNGSVLEGLEATSPEVEESTSDLISQLVYMINGAENEVNNAKAEALSDIEGAKNEALQAIGKADTTPLANSLKATASGEIIRVDDVSPLEHTARAKVQGKNVDPATVTVTRCGKNLWSYKPSTVINGVTVTTDEVGRISFKGTCTKDFVIHETITLGKGTYTLSDNASGNKPDTIDARTQVYIPSLGVDARIKHSDDPDTSITFEISKVVTDVNIRIKGAGGFTYDNYVISPLLELGNEATKHEKCEKETYTPKADGTIDIVAVSPTMTLLTDTEGVTIDLEYNQDTNVALGNVKADLAEADRVIAEVSDIVSDIETSLDNVIAKYELGGDVQ